MPSEMKLTVSHNDKLLHTVTKTVEKQQFVKSLEEFQKEANVALTKMIEEFGNIVEGGSYESLMTDDEDNEEDEDEDDGSVDSSLSAEEEAKGHSQSKKQRHY